MSGQTCADCRFWDRPPSYQSGLCRRLPPRQVRYLGVGGVEYETLWPLTVHDDWCGEHEPQDKPE